jgi:putative membrane protein
MKLIIRWVITALALVVAVWIVPGLRVEGDAWVAYALTAAVLGLINAFLRPLLKVLSCPLILVTLGLFVLVLNGLMLMLASHIAVSWFHVGFYVDGFWAAFWGALIVSLVSIVLNLMVREPKFDRHGGYRR